MGKRLSRLIFSTPPLVATLLAAVLVAGVAGWINRAWQPYVVGTEPSQWRGVLIPDLNCQDMPLGDALKLVEKHAGPMRYSPAAQRILDSGRNRVSVHHRNVEPRKAIPSLLQHHPGSGLGLSIASDGVPVIYHRDEWPEYVVDAEFWIGLAGKRVFKDSTWHEWGETLIAFVRDETPYGHWDHRATQLQCDEPTQTLRVRNTSNAIDGVQLVIRYLEGGMMTHPFHALLELP